MKQLLLILSILLTCTAAQAQRYRLVADSTFEYAAGTLQSVPTIVKKYSYRKENMLEWGDPDKDEVPFDTLYSCSPIDTNGGLVITSLEVRKYNSKGNPIANVKYMADWLFSLDVEHQKDVSFRLKDSDTLIYNDKGLLIERRFFGGVRMKGKDVMKEISKNIYHYTGDKCVRELIYGYNDGKQLKLYSDTKYGYDVNGRRVYEDMRMVIGEDAEYRTFSKTVYNNNGDLLYSMSKDYADTALDPSKVVFSDTLSFGKCTYINGRRIDSFWVAKAITTQNGGHKNKMMLEGVGGEYRTDSSIIRIGFKNVIPGYGPVKVRTTSSLNGGGYPTVVIEEFLPPKGEEYILLSKTTYTYEQY